MAIKRYDSLKDWREAHGLSQRDAAKILGMSQSAYAKWEIHRRAPRPNRLKALVAKTGVRIESLIGIA